MPESIPELALANARTREALTDTVGRIKQKSNVPERWRLFVARSRQQLHRDPTPLVAMMVTAGAGVAMIVLGSRIGQTSAGHLEAADAPMLQPKFKPAKRKKDGTLKGQPSFKRKPDKKNPVEKDRKRG
jgi:hypothetical protein